MTAVRLARATAGRDRVLKFAGCYHGHADSLLANAGSGLATLGIPSSPGVPAAVRFEAGGRRRYLDEADMDQREEEEGIGVVGEQGPLAAERPEVRAGQRDIGGRGHLEQIRHQRLFVGKMNDGVLDHRLRS